MTKACQSDLRSPVAKRILTYLVNNPNAAGTLESIVEWWLLEENIDYQIREVKRALKELVANELVLHRSGINGRTIYRLNAQQVGKTRDSVKVNDD